MCKPHFPSNNFNRKQRKMEIDMKVGYSKIFQQLIFIKLVDMVTLSTNVSLKGENKLLICKVCGQLDKTFVYATYCFMKCSNHVFNFLFFFTNFPTQIFCMSLHIYKPSKHDSTSGTNLFEKKLGIRL